MITEPRIDPFSKKPFMPKRRNHRFATKQNRIAFHNQQATNLREDRRFIDVPLSQNHKILRELLANKNEAHFHKQFLLGKGFSFKHISHSEEYNGKMLPAVYEFVWIADPDAHTNKPSETIKILKLKKNG